jgi:hypothetical protein
VTITTTDRLLLDELARLGRRHIDEGQGQLVMLEADPERYCAQQGVHLAGAPQPPVVIEGVAVLAEARFPELLAAMTMAEARHGSLTTLAKHLRQGGNCVLVTNHGSLIDIALAEAALVCALAHHDVTFRTGIIISKVVSMIGITLGTEMLAAADALTMLCDDVFLSFPRTKEVAQSALTTELGADIDLHNTAVKDLVRGTLDAGSTLLAMAPSGSVDRSDPTDDTTILLEGLSRGTMAWLQRPDVMVLPIAVWLRDRAATLEVVEGPRRITDDHEAHAMMHEMASVLTKNVARRRFVYEGPVTRT